MNLCGRILDQIESHMNQINDQLNESKSFWHPWRVTQSRFSYWCASVRRVWKRLPCWLWLLFSSRQIRANEANAHNRLFSLCNNWRHTGNDSWFSDKRCRDASNPSIRRVEDRLVVLPLCSTRVPCGDGSMNFWILLNCSISGWRRVI